jgi:hypothetical protein
LIQGVVGEGKSYAAAQILVKLKRYKDASLFLQEVVIDLDFRLYSFVEVVGDGITCQFEEETSLVWVQVAV